MPNGFDLTISHYDALDANEAAIRTMRQMGEKKAAKEADYNVALAKAMLDLRANGTAASMCERLAKGNKDVALAYVDWQNHETLYAAAKEHVQLTKRRADAIRDQIAREWTMAGGKA